jgi:hypothetical protein
LFQATKSQRCWLPQPDNLYEIDSHLAGRGLANEFGNLAPQYWYYTSSTK